jgi:hypothetical protein
VRTNTCGIGAKRARLNDWVPGLDVEIAHRRKHPIDADRARLSRRDRRRRIRRVEIVQVAERRRGGKLRETAHLLPRATLEIGTDQQWPARFIAEGER